MLHETEDLLDLVVVVESDDHRHLVLPVLVGRVGVNVGTESVHRVLLLGPAGEEEALGHGVNVVRQAVVGLVGERLIVVNDEERNHLLVGDEGPRLDLQSDDARLTLLRVVEDEERTRVGDESEDNLLLDRARVLSDVRPPEALLGPVHGAVALIVPLLLNDTHIHQLLQNPLVIVAVHVHELIIHSVHRLRHGNIHGNSLRQHLGLTGAAPKSVGNTRHLHTSPLFCTKQIRF